MNKEIILGYEVERKRVKNINLRVRSDGSVYISVPLNIDEYSIIRYIESKKDWIEKSKKKIDEFKKKKVEETYTNDSRIKFMGRSYTLKVIKATYNQLVFEENKFILYTDTEEFEKRKRIVEKFYYDESKKLFTKRIDFWKNIMEEEVDRLIFKNIKSKWGYCQPAKKLIALNIQLIKRSPFEIDYVIVHELAHLKHPDHSKNFYRHVEKFLKNYKEAENLLKYI